MKKQFLCLTVILLSMLISPSYAQPAGAKAVIPVDSIATSYEGQPFKKVLQQIKSAQVPGDQKLLMYRKLMPFALTAGQKNTILKEAGKIKTYPSIFYVANYLNDPATSAVAAKAVMSIALPQGADKQGLDGKLIKEILIKAVPLLKGGDSEKLSQYITSMPGHDGFYSMFNGKDLAGWQGLVDDPVKRAKMSPSELASKQAEADGKVPGNWTVKDGCIWFSGKGNNLCSKKDYGDFELFADWKITRGGDSGLYLRGSPQVQIWDPLRIKIGSGGLYNNKIHPSKPLVIADNPVGDWNTFRVIMKGEKVTVWLNGILVVDNVTMENYWDRNIPIFPKGAIELQAHGNELAFRDIYVKEF